MMRQRNQYWRPRPWYQNWIVRLLVLILAAIATVILLYFSGSFGGESNEERLERLILEASGISVECDLLEIEYDIVRGVCHYDSSLCYIDVEKRESGADTDDVLVLRSPSEDCRQLTGASPSP